MPAAKGYDIRFVGGPLVGLELYVGETARDGGSRVPLAGYVRIVGTLKGPEKTIPVEFRAHTLGTGVVFKSRNEAHE